ncbi:HK97 gp10 family phage protein [Aminipila luticellarii]|uniref:HK97 gp10 family phage protein n=1 Tax=Aminipila luticellarii TaxID=2507160 RepID=UPI00196B5400|nr:HK97 gp10 family phage protein [Aminipila luticellarii]
MTGIDTSQLAGEITRGLEKYSKDVVKAVNVSSEKIGKAAVKKLKETSPKRQGKGGGDYAKSWKMTTEPAVGQPDNRIIHAGKPHYRLTHLLENGHAKAGGGRVAARPHIGKVEEEVIKDFMTEVEEEINNGGAS